MRTPGSSSGAASHVVVASAIEIFLQNVLTSVVAGVLFWTAGVPAARIAAPAYSSA
jgi:hypothetical protein